jgi:hypothetical protein
MQISDAQKEVRTVFAGGFFGQLVSSAVWLSAAALGTWISPRAGIEALVGCGFFIFPLTMLCLRMAGRRTAVSRENPMGQLAMQTAFGLVVTMLLLAPVAQFRLELFFPAMMVLLGAHYLPFTFLYGMRMFLVLAALLAGGGVVLGIYVHGPFSLGGWVGGGLLFAFAWIGRGLVGREAGRYSVSRS